MTGAGPKAFVAGADIGELLEVAGQAEKAAELAAFGQGVFRRLETIGIMEEGLKRLDPDQELRARVAGTAALADQANEQSMRNAALQQRVLASTPGEGGPVRPHP